MPDLRRSSRARAQDSSNSKLENEDVEPVSSRRSARSNKFASSMKEPNNSISDLLNGMSGKLPAYDSRKRKSKYQRGSPGRRVSAESSEVDSESEDEDDIFDEENPPPLRRSVRSRAATKSAAVRRSSTRQSDSDSDSEDDEDLSEEEQPTLRRSSRPRAKMNASKSPAAQHSSTRRRIKTQVQSSSESEDEESEESHSSSESEDEDEIKIQRVIASRVEPKKKWRKLMEGMNTSEIEHGSRWFQDGDLDDDSTLEERFLIKWSDLSYLHSSWESREDLIDQVEGSKTYLSTFFRKNQNGFIFDADERMDGEYFDPGLIQVDRILEVVQPELGRRHMKDFGIIFEKDDPDYESGTGRQFLIKWKTSPYSEATYEFERDLILNDVEYLEHIESFVRRKKKPSKTHMTKAFAMQDNARRRLYKTFGDQVPDSEAKEAAIEDYKNHLAEITFKNGGKLRDYQAEGVSWLLANHINKRSAILADEMGLGKVNSFFHVIFLS